MGQARLGVIVALCLAMAWPLRGGAAETPLSRAISLMGSADFAGAARVVSSMRDGAAVTYYDWRRLRAGRGAFGEYVRSRRQS